MPSPSPSGFGSTPRSAPARLSRTRGCSSNYTASKIGNRAPSLRTPRLPRHPMDPWTSPAMEAQRPMDSPWRGVSAGLHLRRRTRSCCRASIEGLEFLLGFTLGEVDCMHVTIQPEALPSIHKLIWIFAPLSKGIFSSSSLLVSSALYLVFWDLSIC